MRPGAWTAAILAVLTAGWGGLATADAKLSRGKQRAQSQPATGQFASTCLFSHRLPDDPIVRPGIGGASHMHDFLGNRSTNAASTAASLRAAGTTSCRRAEDLAAYWVPTLYQTGRAVKPVNATAYYRTAGRVPATIRSFPANLKLIAGNSAAMGPQDKRVVAWMCEGGKPQTSPPLCMNRKLALVVHFPDCWDGFSLDSVDHKSHLAYARGTRAGGRACPQSHSVPVPNLTLHVRYRTRGGRSVTLASGPTHTAHADFFNTWRQPTLDALVHGG
jgi:hypothetical protein